MAYSFEGFLPVALLVIGTWPTFVVMIWWGLREWFEALLPLALSGFIPIFRVSNSPFGIIASHG